MSIMLVGVKVLHCFAHTVVVNGNNMITTIINEKKVFLKENVLTLRLTYHRDFEFMIDLERVIKGHDYHSSNSTYFA